MTFGHLRYLLFAILEDYSTKKLDVKGEISTVEPDLNRVYKWGTMETEEVLFNFSLLVLVGHRRFLLQVIHSNMEVYWQ